MPRPKRTASVPICFCGAKAKYREWFNGKGFDLCADHASGDRDMETADDWGWDGRACSKEE